MNYLQLRSGASFPSGFQTVEGHDLNAIVGAITGLQDRLDNSDLGDDVNPDLIAVRLWKYIPLAQRAAIAAKTSTYACDSAFAQALAALPATGGKIVFGGGKFVFHATVIPDRPVFLSGAGRAATILSFPVDTTGILINYPAAAYSIVSRLTVLGVKSGTVGFGIDLNARATIVDATVSNFSSHGINVEASTPSANANEFQIMRCVVSGCNNGLYANGSDSNAGTIIGSSFASNRGWGVYDSSFLGNYYFGCHTASNAGGSYKADSLDSEGCFDGCYVEPGQPGPDIVDPWIIVGGQLASAGNIGDATTYGRGLTAQAAKFTSLSLSSATTGIGEYLKLLNGGSLSGARGARVGLYAGYEVDGVTPHPVASLRGSGGGGLNGQGEVRLEVYDGPSASWITALGITGGHVSLFPAASVTPTVVGEVTLELTNDTTLKFKWKASDGSVKTAVLTGS